MTHSLTTRVLGAAAAAAVLLGLAACSSPPHAASNGTAKAKAATTTAFEWDLAKAKCMRDAGFDFPDPTPGGGTGGPQGVEGDPEAFFAGDAKCDKSTAGRLGERPVTAAEKKENDAWLAHDAAYKQCLRKAGYDVPEDPFSYETSTALSKIPDDVSERCDLVDAGKENR